MKYIASGENINVVRVELRNNADAVQIVVSTLDGSCEIGIGVLTVNGILRLHRLDAELASKFGLERDADGYLRRDYD